MITEMRKLTQRHREHGDLNVQKFPLSLKGTRARQGRGPG